uniref:Putative sigma class glutathione-s-transferase 2 n=1 Tax=Pinctada fucata TaxID=50426 RepID=A0A194APU9_PINFU
MPKYKLHYFGVRGRGEIIRLVLTVAGQDFEDRRITQEEWPKVKSEIPSGQVPLLEVDGKHMNESLAIARYLAREYDLGGKTNHEQYLVDRVVGAVDDYFTKAVQILFLEKDEKKKAELQKALDDEHTPRFLKLFTKYLEESGGDGDFFVGNSGTLADLAVHDCFTTFLKQNDKLLDKYPKLQANRKATEALPHMADYLAKRPDVPI